MAEIRVRDASPELIKQLEQIALELKEATIAGLIVRLIPRYHDMKKRIVEQNNEIGKLSNELRTAEYRLSTARAELNNFVGTMGPFIKFAEGTRKKLQDQAQKFGTKKSRPASSSKPRKAKNVPKKKPVSKPKNKK